MDVGLIFKIAAIGILVSVLNQVLACSGRDEQATIDDAFGSHNHYAVESLQFQRI